MRFTRLKIGQSETKELTVKNGTNEPSIIGTVAKPFSFVSLEEITGEFPQSTVLYFWKNYKLQNASFEFALEDKGYGIAGVTDENRKLNFSNLFIRISTANGSQFVRTLEDNFNDFRGTCSEVVTEIKIYGIKSDTTEVLLATTTPFFSEGSWRFQECLEFSEDDFDENESITLKAVSESIGISDQIQGVVRDIMMLVPSSTVSTSSAYSCIGYGNVANLAEITVSVYKRVSESPPVFAWVDIGTLTALNGLITGDIDCSSLGIGSVHIFKFVCGTAEVQYSYMVVGV
jgi:hypothetical protein